MSRVPSDRLVYRPRARYWMAAFWLLYGAVFFGISALFPAGIAVGLASFALSYRWTQTRLEVVQGKVLVHNVLRTRTFELRDLVDVRIVKNLSGYFFPWRLHFRGGRSLHVGAFYGGVAFNDPLEAGVHAREQMLALRDLQIP